MFLERNDPSFEFLLGYSRQLNFRQRHCSTSGPGCSFRSLHCPPLIPEDAAGLGATKQHSSKILQLPLVMAVVL